MRYSRFLAAATILLAGIIGIVGSASAEVAGGNTNKPFNILSLMGHGVAEPPPLDTVVGKQLTEQGYTYQVVSDQEPLTLDDLRQFNTVVPVGIDDFSGGGYYAPGGLYLLNTANNIKLLHQYVAEGGGLVVVPIMPEAGSQVASNYGAMLEPLLATSFYFRP